MSDNSKIYALVTLIGGGSGILIGYVINSGLGMGGFDNSLYWVGGGVAVALLRAKVSPALKHLFK
jgi:hypothetical protein